MLQLSLSKKKTLCKIFYCWVAFPDSQILKMGFLCHHILLCAGSRPHPPISQKRQYLMNREHLPVDYVKLVYYIAYCFKAVGRDL